jgi:hypothetical protein
LKESVPAVEGTTSPLQVKTTLSPIAGTVVPTSGVLANPLQDMVGVVGGVEGVEVPPTQLSSGPLEHLVEELIKHQVYPV